jgi:hypothetical protein
MLVSSVKFHQFSSDSITDMAAFERSFQGLSNDMQGLGLKAAQMFVLFCQS